MRRILTLVLWAILPALAQEGRPVLMPQPASVHYLEGRLDINAGFTVGIDGFQGDRLVKAANRFIARLDGRTALFFEAWQVSDKSADLTLRVRREGRLELGEAESYRLWVDASGATLEAETDLGGLRGLETLLQLLSADENGFYFPAVVIDDAPRFAWRGLLIDACRHWMPPEVIRRNLDGMAAMKMNVLHWHLSEDQGFRVACKTFPKLHELGSDGLYYTQDEIRELIADAADRGIRVVPEFDMPGHATAWLVGYPELASAPGPYAIERRWGVMDPVMDPTKESTYRFLDAFIGEMASLFPDAYFHIGGDENNGKHWNANPAIQAFMKKEGIADNHALQAYFNQRVLAMLQSRGKKMVGWDEIFHESMPQDIVIHSWRGREAMVEAARRGYQTILSNGYYIDLMQSAEFHYLNDPCPADAPLSSEERQRILGGEATMWSEMVSPETVDSRIWPRTAAIAERLWSPESVRDVDDLYRRLDVVSRQLEEHGLTHLKNRDRLLRRLTRGGDIHPLMTLLGAAEPVERYQRGAQKAHFQYSPLTRLVDAATADAPQARTFRHWVAGLLDHDPVALEAVPAMKILLSAWTGNHALVQALAKQAPGLTEIVPLSEALSQLATVAAEALAVIEVHGQKADPAWMAQARTAIEAAKAPHGQMELVMVEAVSQLVEAAAR